MQTRVLVLAALILLALATLGVQGAKEKEDGRGGGGAARTAARYFKLAQESLRGKQIKRAISQLKTVIKLEPRHVGAHYELGVLYMNGEHKDELMAALARGNEARQTAGTPLLEVAIEHFDKALGVDSDFVQARINVATCHLRLGRLDDAVEQFELALDTNDTVVQAWYNLGLAYTRLNEYPQAIAALENATVLAPGDQDVWTQLALARLLNDSMDAAGEAYQRARDLAPKDPYAPYTIGSALNHRNLYAESVPYLEQATRLAPDMVQAWVNLGSSLLALDKRSEALKACQEVVRLRPEWAVARFNLGNALRAVGMLKQARIQMYQAAEMGHMPAFYHLGTMLMESGDWENAQAQFERVVQWQPTSREATYQLANIHWKHRKDPEKAIKYMETVVALDPDNHLVRADLQRMKAKLGDFRRAQERAMAREREHAS